MIAWIGVGTTRGVPRPIVDRLNQELRRVIALPNVDEQLRSLGGLPKSSTPEEATERVKHENSALEEAGGTGRNSETIAQG